MLNRINQAILASLGGIFRFRPHVLVAIALFSAALLTSLILWVFTPNLSTFEERLGGLTWRLFSDDTLEERITVVAIDERSLAEIGPWPWSRDLMAELTRRINRAGAQLQAHDIVYPEREQSVDLEFQASLTEGNASIIAQLPVITEGQSINSGRMTHSVSGVSCEAQAGSIFPKSESFIGSSQWLSSVPKGHISPIIDSDGAIRKMPAMICLQGALYPALSISPFFAALKSENWEVQVTEGAGILSPPYKLSLEPYPGLEIPLDENGNIRFSFRKSPSVFRSVSAVDILNDEFDPAMFDNVWVLVGATAFALDDVVPTPYTGSAPGVELQARMIASILDGSVPYGPLGSEFLNIFIASLFGVLLFAFALLRGKYATIGFSTISLLAPVVTLSIHGVALINYSIWLGWLGPAIFAFVGGLMLLLLELVRLRFERGRVMQNLTSYLPGDAARRVAFELPSSNIEASRCEVTLLCADLRNFSAIGESRPPEESASVLHFFFTKVNSIVEEHGGKIQEYKGDSVLALWDGNGVKAATRALLSAQKIEKEFNESLSPEIGIDGLEPLAVGVGIEQGPVLMGSIGPANRRAHTLCGETVSVTLRIQEMTADLACNVLIGEVAARHLQDFRLQSLGSFLLPGLTTSHQLFSSDPQEIGAVRDGLTLLKGGLG